MAKTVSSYDDSSISQLIGADRIRTRPASMLGSSGLEGAQHGFIEMYGNALDERSAGFGDRLDVVYYEDGSVSIRDYGRGVPIGWNSVSNNWNWHLIYNELYAGGKYDNGQWYLQSIGKWTDFTTKSKFFYNPVQKNLNVNLKEMTIDPEQYVVFGDIDLMRKGTDLWSIRVNDESWATVTWEKLNRRLNYLASVGLNGLGAASTQYTSEFFTVRSYRDGRETSRKFERGIPLVEGKPFDMFRATLEEIKAIPEEIETTNEPNGTFIHWKPDDVVFDNVNIGGKWLYNVCRDIADVAGIKLHFEDRQTGEVYDIESGTLLTLAERHCGTANIKTKEDGTPYIGVADNYVHGDIRVEGENFTYVARCDIAFAVVNTPVSNSCYHNSVRMAFGRQYEAIDAAIMDFMNEKAKTRGVKLTYQDFQDKITVFVSSFSNYASFRNQTKDAIDDVFIYNMIRDCLHEALQVEYGKGNKVIRDMVESVIKEAELRIATKEWQKIKRDADRVKREKAPEKFVSCKAYEDKKYADAELWITEGDSAKGCVKDARNKDFQAIYPIRGKGLNVFKKSLDKILKNKEIREIFSIIGTGFDLNIRGEKTFNIEDLRFNKIIFATDADEDGYQIRVLLFSVFYRLAPELLTKGYIYIAETPRFQIILTDGTEIFALNDVERDEVLKANVGKIKTVQRFKGLGEQDAAILRKTTVHPDTRNLIQLTCDLNNESERTLIDALFGNDKYKMRKQLLIEALGLEDDMLSDDTVFVNTLNRDFEDDEAEDEDSTEEE